LCWIWDAAAESFDCRAAAGSQTALGVDIEQNAVKIAMENAEKNGISPQRFTALCGDVISDAALRARSRMPL
jgi:23S rRNA G2069 N7-methylase RlmK/C1962 C5-methylase RlmI